MLKNSIKMMVILVFITFGITSCLGTKPNKPVFAYEPYNHISCEDKYLYNYVMNISRDQLAKYVDEDHVSYPDMIGIVMEIRKEGHKKYVHDIIKGPVNYAWSIFDKDIIEIPAEEYVALRRGIPLNCELCRYPRAKYNIQIDGHNATAFIQYWTTLNTYQLIYTFHKTGAKWELDDIEQF